ncbi:DUF887-domain-containing protein [Glonium stellatum]|uniref:DUF887-domain-containing protein n=1 Tax=Glonium stellatum TaxID=574774 RepID=A0A8E2JSQ4_9PEZI|nr:DUF887-domain-containing protein [Glonium stellatum]
MRDPFLPAPLTIVQVTTPIANRLGLSTLPWHVHEIALAFLCYQFMFTILSPAVSMWIVPDSYRRLPRRSRTGWNVNVVSLIQSTFITACASYVLKSDVGRSKMGWQERLWGYDGATGMVQSFAAGYFLWDLQVSINHLDVLGTSSLLHAIGALLVTSIGFRPFANYYGLNFILYELSTPFLNIHWFLDKLNMTGSRAQLLNGIILIITFGCCRLLWGTYQSVLIYNDIWTAWNSPLLFKNERNCATFIRTNSGEAGLNGECGMHFLPTWLVIVYLGSNTVLSVLNFYWFGRMIKAILKRFNKSNLESVDSQKTEIR